MLDRLENEGVKVPKELLPDINIKQRSVVSSMNRHRAVSKKFNSTSGRNLTEYSNYLSNSKKGEFEWSERTLVSHKEDVVKDVEREIAHLN